MQIKRAAKLLALYGATVSAESRLRKRIDGVDKRNELNEDIEFWTRMTQYMSLPIQQKPSRRPTPRPSRRPSPKPTPRPSPRPSPKPTPRPVPSQPLPVSRPTPLPTDFDTPAPTFLEVFPTPMPTDIDTPNPTPEPTPNPTPGPTPNPTPQPTPQPSPQPTEQVSLPCGLTPEQRATSFTNLALSITPQSTLSNPFSSQSLALSWLINDDDPITPVCPNADNCKALERYIMASFYFASGGGKWDQCNAPLDFTEEAIEAANQDCERVVTPFPVNNPRIGEGSTDAWLTPSDACEWGGLACWGTDDSRGDCMDQLDFENDGIAGTLIPEMSNLDDLRFFILEQGNTTGTIPTEYGLFDRLLIFGMDFNKLTGEIPQELFDLNQLQQLDLNDNNLEGTLATDIGQLTTLTFVQLDHNLLSGTIPTEMGELKALRIAFFNNNDFTGSMPEEVCANRNNTNPPGFLGTLVADCNPPNDPEVECSCCSSCNVD